MATSILFLNLFLNTIYINGVESCVISSQPVKQGSVVVGGYEPQTLPQGCEELASDVFKAASNDFPNAAITVSINGVNLNRI